jgi:repressor LexA
MAITKRQKEVLDFIRNFVERCGYSPSFEEIASGLDLSSLATVHKHISNLERKGLLNRAHNRSRSIDLTPERKPATMQDIPLMGRIAAGRPLEAMEFRDSLSLNDIVDGTETTLKHYYLEGDTVRLQPANSEMEPIFVPAAQVAIQGRVLAIVRKFA